MTTAPDVPARPSPEQLTARIPILGHLGIRVVPSPREGVFSAVMELGPQTRNAQGVTHGGVLATLVDFCGAMAVGGATGRGGPTIDLHVRFLRAGRGNALRADATVVKAGRRVVVVDVRVFDDHEVLVAIGTAAFAPGAGGPPSWDAADETGG